MVGTATEEMSGTVAFWLTGVINPGEAGIRLPDLRLCTHRVRRTRCVAFPWFERVDAFLGTASSNTVFGGSALIVAR